jgi:hypothetical protein
MGQANQLFHNASTIFIRAALNAGSTPPIKPMTNANRSAIEIISKVREKLKASSENVCQFIVETVKNCKKDAKKSPIQPPINARNKDSIRKLVKILTL